MANKRITDVDFIESLNSDESFFVNQNSTIKQINKSDIVFGITNGGTGATTIAGARDNLGLGNTDGALPIANGGTGATTAENARANIGAASTAIYNGILPSSGWSNSAPYTQTIIVDGILNTDYPLVDINLSEASDPTSIIEAWRLIGRCTVSANNTIVTYCYQEAPAVDIPIIFKVVR